MTYPVLLQTVMDRARRRANLEGATAFISDPELIDEINESYAEWWDIVRLTTWGGQYDRKAFSFTTTNGTDGYDLPDDFLNLISVDVFFASNQVLSAKPYQEEQRNAYRWYPVGWLFSQPVFYQLQGGKIVFIPVPQSRFNVTLNYVPVQAKLVTPDTDSFNSINGWESWIVYDVAAKLLLKDGDVNAGNMIAQREKQEARIRAVAAERDQGNAEHIHDVMRDFDDWETM